MAAYSVASGVLPPGDFQSPLASMAAIMSVAALLDRIRGWTANIYPNRGVLDTAINLWDLVAILAWEAGTGEYDGKVGLPPSPTDDQKIAIGLIEELAEAANRFEAETGWEFPLPRTSQPVG
jgi:hypothetical protein